jgi:hypothetical protein
VADDIIFYEKINDAAINFPWGEDTSGAGATQSQVLIAEVEIEFTEFPGELAEDEKLRSDLQTLYQRKADQSFGNGKVFVTVSLRAGSVTVIVVLVAAGNFFKNYKEISDGVKAFVGDVKATARETKKLFKRK